MIQIELGAVDGHFVREHLQQVLNTHRFKSSPQLATVLRFLVEETLAARSDKLRQYVIATEALGRSEDFDPDADPTVRVLMARLRKTLDAHYGLEGRTALIRLTVPVGSYVPRLTAFKTEESHKLHDDLLDEAKAGGGGFAVLGAQVGRHGPQAWAAAAILAVVIGNAFGIQLLLWR